MQIDFQKCCEKIAGSLNEFCNRWCKREHVKGLEIKYLQNYRSTYFLYSQNTNMLPRKPKINYRYLKSGIEELHRKSRKENPQKLTQLSSRSHPRHPAGKRTAQKETTIETTSDSQANSNHPHRRPPASLTFNNYFYLFFIFIYNVNNHQQQRATSKTIKEPKQKSRLGTASNNNYWGGLQLVCGRPTFALSSALVPQTFSFLVCVEDF